MEKLIVKREARNGRERNRGEKVLDGEVEREEGRVRRRDESEGEARNMSRTKRRRV